MRKLILVHGVAAAAFAVAMASCSHPKPVIAPEPAATQVTPAPEPSTPSETAPSGTMQVQSEPKIAPAGVPESGVAASELPADVEAINRAGYLADAFFDTDKAELRSDTRDVLATDAIWLKAHPTIKILVEGHCDERNTEEYNLALGWRRANAVKDYLVSLGVSPDNIATISYGEEKPFATGHDESAWSQNRRAHFVVTAR
jgi:peptidoglycan-associated lipoprotein